MGKTIIQDTREQKGKHEHVLKWFEDNEYKVVRSKLFCGDYSYLNNQSICIDTKKDMLEICQNVVQSHKRFTDEIKRAIENDIKLVFLIEEPGISCLEDVANWKNPRRFYSDKATKGEQLYKILKTIEERYNTKFYFCDKAETGQKIIEILEAK